MSRNGNLTVAKAARHDEFYTRFADVERELAHYRARFRGKVVYCNCDDPSRSSFWRYFHLNFGPLGLRRLVSTHYRDGKSSYAFEYGGGDDNDVSAGVRTELSGDGDFRSPECAALLDECDVVVTNPPFSLFREFAGSLTERGKKFLIVGNVNAVTYKEFFPLLQRGEVWPGCAFNETWSFVVPDDYVATAVEGGERLAKVPGICWYTNLDHDRRHEPLELLRTYNPSDYPRYDNYDAINVGRTADIPADYDGLMGVPVSFLGRYCPEQFELVWKAFGNTRATTQPELLDALGYRKHPEDRGGLGVINGRRVYARLLIRRR